MIDGLLRIPIRRFEDERGWFAELRRESQLPRRTVQTNVSFSRRGVIRGLHYHERGQDDLFVCLHGRARVVVLDRTSGETFSEDIGDDVYQQLRFDLCPECRKRFLKNPLGRKHAEQFDFSKN